MVLLAMADFAPPGRCGRDGARPAPDTLASGWRVRMAGRLPARRLWRALRPPRRLRWRRARGPPLQRERGSVRLARGPAPGLARGHADRERYPPGRGRSRLSAWTE